MLFRCRRFFASTSSHVERVFDVSESLYQKLRKGYVPPVSKSRKELLSKFPHDLMERGVDDASLLSKSPRDLALLLLQLHFDKLYAVPFQLIAFDLEFTDLPTFTKEGPTASIVEIGMYHPHSQQSFECLVRPTNPSHNMAENASKLTGITQEMLMDPSTKTFPEAWSDALKWIDQLPQEKTFVKSSVGRGDGEPLPCLLLSHGGRLADVSMLKWECSQGTASSSLPSHFTFGDTFSIIRERHRRRPVTANRMPPAWGLMELLTWMGIEAPGLRAHRAGPDAEMTWMVLDETLKRYGTEYLTSKQQLGELFFKTFEKSAVEVEAPASHPYEDQALMK
eukprot:PhF_6_TR30774/c0_g1_i1/m.45324